MAVAEATRHLVAFVAALAAACLTLAAPAQGPTVRAAFAASAHRGAVPGLDWLCNRWLPARPEWPRARDLDLPFAVEIGAAGLRVLDDVPRLPPGLVAAGAVAEGPRDVLLFACRDDGREDWWIPREADVPPTWRERLVGLGADVLDEPRRLDAAVVIGHLAGALAEGDPQATLLRLGAASCGEVTWTAWRTAEHLRVRGRSDGGLLLPAALLWLADQRGHAGTAPVELRAFAARDGDRAEAARQCVRSPGDDTERALEALLHADDQVAFAAVDALRRLGAADALPRIVAAAGPDAPWTSLAAADALRALWPAADPATRQATRAAVGRSRSADVRAAGLGALSGLVVSPAAAEAAAETAALRVRMLVVLALFAIGFYGFWARERALLRTCDG